MFGSSSPIPRCHVFINPPPHPNALDGKTNLSKCRISHLAHGGNDFTQTEALSPPPCPPKPVLMQNQERLQISRERELLHLGSTEISPAACQPGRARETGRIWRREGTERKRGEKGDCRMAGRSREGNTVTQQRGGQGSLGSQE